MTTQSQAHKRQGDGVTKARPGFADGSKATQFPPKHGMSTNDQGGRSPTYTAWRTMRQRCNDPRHKSYGRYGGRGITVCPQWDDFTVFLRDMGEKPLGMTLGRLDNDGNYEPRNCRWETLVQQANNRCSNRLIRIGGVTRSLTEWARDFGLRTDTVAWRINSGWGIMKALTTPVHNRVVKG